MDDRSAQTLRSNIAYPDPGCVACRLIHGIAGNYFAAARLHVTQQHSNEQRVQPERCPFCYDLWAWFNPDRFIPHLQKDHSLPAKLAMVLWEGMG